MEVLKTPKNATLFQCNKCNFNCSKNSDWSRHLLTRKHNMEVNGNDWKSKNAVCEICEKTFKTASGLWKHQKKCSSLTAHIENTKMGGINASSSIPDMTIVIDLLKQNQELQKQLLDAVKFNGSHIENQSITNNNQQKFNLNFFLNDTCKDAMNMTDFIENMNVQFEDIENIGRNGYVAGMTDLILSRIKNLDVTKRPMHCTDMKRETIYIKDNDVWEKDANNAKLHKMIGCIAHQNYGIIPAWRDKYPDSTNAETPKFEFCITMMRNVLGDAGDEQTRLDNKVIRNVTKHINVDKQPDTMET